MALCAGPPGNVMAVEKFYGLTLGALAVWRVTHLLHAEDGPWDSLARLRRRLGNGFLGQIADCFYCLSVWVAAPASYLLSDKWLERVLTWLALSGSACLLERATNRGESTSPAVYVEDEEVDDVLR